MAFFLVYLIICAISFLIIFTFLAVLVRRFYMTGKYRKLDLERQRYAWVHDRLSSGAAIDDIEELKNRPASYGWLVVEEKLLKALGSGNADNTRIEGYFDELGYSDHYIKTLEDGNKWEKALAADKLGRIRCKKAVPYLISALDGEFRDLRNMAVYSLGQIKEERAVPHLIKRLRQAVLNDEDVSLRLLKSSMISMGELALPGLLGIFNDPAWHMRAAVADILAELEFPGVPEALLKALADPEQDVRAKAAKGLGKALYFPAVPDLLKGLSDPYWVVRLHSARALGLMKVTEAIDPLRDTLCDRNWQVRNVAAEALAMIGGRAFKELLEVCISSKDEYARDQTIDEMERIGITRAIMDSVLSGEAEALYRAKEISEICDMDSVRLRAGPAIAPEMVAEMVKMLGTLNPDRLRGVIEDLSMGNYTLAEIDSVIFAINGYQARFEEGSKEIGIPFNRTHILV